jgi:hypothetical protein
MSILAERTPVLYWEEPIESSDGIASLTLEKAAPNVTVARPRLPPDCRTDAAAAVLRGCSIPIWPKTASR